MSSRKLPWRTYAALCVALAPSTIGHGVEPGPTEVIEMPKVEVIGTREQAEEMAGGASLLHRHDLEATRPLTTSEALRKLPGVNARDEEGMGLRPNVGIRGLNPTRSTKVTLLEDGIPLAYAPYGDNASYYHPPIERYTGVELLTGAEQLRFGPQTVGGTINYTTPGVRGAFGGFAQGVLGERSIGIGQVEVGGRDMLFGASLKRADGAREHMEFELHDFSYKAMVDVGERQALTVRANLYTEDSRITYSGLTQAEYLNFGARYNPFENDEFDAIRRGGSVTHRYDLDRGSLITSLYAATFDRDWWRQSSTTTDTQCGTGFRDDRLAGIAVDPGLCNSAQGRLRSYHHWGIEPRLTLENGLGELLAGVRYHVEAQDRLQVNATSPTGRTGTTVEDSRRETTATSAFVAQRFAFGDWSVLAALRQERVESERLDRLTSLGGSDSLSELMPGLGVNWKPSAGLTLFADVHRGFAPPRTEDVISGTGTSTDVQAEESLNLEAGMRWRRDADLELNATVFRNDFDRLTAVGSIAGGSTPLAQGKALFAGLELATGWRLTDAWSVHANYTWMATAEQSQPFVEVATGLPVAGSAAGLRQPYAPEHLLTANLQWAGSTWHAALELQHTAEQYADFANTVAPSADGQRGVIDAASVWSLTIDRAFGDQQRTSAFLAVKNLTDETHIVDRTRGIQVGMPRLIEVGLRYEF
jgi:Fe(3+) dicitrate transport protein